MINAENAITKSLTNLGYDQGWGSHFPTNLEEAAEYILFLLGKWKYL